MTKNTKILLGISLAAFVASLTGALWGLFLPIAVIFFGMALIFNVLGKEMSLFDREEQLRMACVEQNAASVPRSQATHREISLKAVPAR